MGVKYSQRADTNVMAPSTGKARYQLSLSPPPSTFTAKSMMNGPQNEETALTTCPAVRLLVNSFWSVTTLFNKGLSDTCRMVLPIPNKAYPTRQAQSVFNNGMSIPTSVTAILSMTVFLRPQAFILMPTGMLKNRNQMKTIEGTKPAMVWLQPNASRA